MKSPYCKWKTETIILLLVTFCLKRAFVHGVPHPIENVYLLILKQFNISGSLAHLQGFPRWL